LEGFWKLLKFITAISGYFFWLLNIQEVERNLFLILSGKYFLDRIIGYINFIIQEKFNSIFICFYSEYFSWLEIKMSEIEEKDETKVDQGEEASTAPALRLEDLKVAIEGMAQSIGSEFRVMRTKFDNLSEEVATI